MNLSEELSKLAELHKTGVLSDDEFVQAKKRLLESTDSTQQSSHPRPYRYEREIEDHSVGTAANRYVTFQIVMAVIGVLVFLLFIAPRMCQQKSSFGGPNIQFSP